ncbi:MAG: hypothetical protein K2O13_03845 [Lachnospiraceae bacterium]|nr:hypothetical protein [Lachnospiraceae bacterium]
MNRAFAHSGNFCRFTHNNNLIAAEIGHENYHRADALVDDRRYSCS